MRAISRVNPRGTRSPLLVLLPVIALACGDDGSEGAATTGVLTSTTHGTGEGSGGGSAEVTGGSTGESGTSGGEGTSAETMSTGGTTSSGGATSTVGPNSTSGEPETTGGGLLELPWTYIAAVDRGIRDDAYGLGHFTAPRQGYQHSGIDFSMPVGTALFAPCEGVYLAGYDGGYGNWVQVICPIPATIAGDEVVYGSLLFAHLDSLALPMTGIDPNNAGAVARGQTIGASGKSGNADVDGLNAHLHFEVAIHPTELAGLQEAHISGADQDTLAAASLRDSLAALCLVPTGFGPTKSQLSLGRRVDPFVFLTCLVGDKPTLTAPTDQSLHAWSDDYAADAFDVNVGIK